jgi:hypothetical protein
MIIVLKNVRIKFANSWDSHQTAVAVPSLLPFSWTANFSSKAAAPLIENACVRHGLPSVSTTGMVLGSLMVYAVMFTG